MRQISNKQRRTRSSAIRQPWHTYSDHKFFHITFSLFLLVIFLIVVVPASAQDSGRIVTDDDVNAIAKELYCPICESTPLDVCATQACADWREVIRTKLGEGQTEEEINAYFLDQYGPRALAEPPRTGVTQLLWILPFLIVITGIIVFYRYMRGATAKNDPELAVLAPDTKSGSSDDEPSDKDYRSKIERELREM